MAKRTLLGITAAIIMMGAFSLLSGVNGTASAGCSDSYNGRVTVFPYGVATIDLDQCAGDAGSGGLQASIDWNGSKDVVAIVIDPDGMAHWFAPGSNDIAVSCPDGEAGTWRLVVKNGSPSRLRATVEASF